MEMEDNDADVEKEALRLYEDFLPLYRLLHAYVRHRLRSRYGRMIRPQGHIPAHLLGNMWAQSWDAILDVLSPFEVDSRRKEVFGNMSVFSMVKR